MGDRKEYQSGYPGKDASFLLSVLCWPGLAEFTVTVLHGKVSLERHCGHTEKGQAVQSPHQMAWEVAGSRDSLFRSATVGEAARVTSKSGWFGGSQPQENHNPEERTSASS